MKGSVVSLGKDINKDILSILEKSLDKGYFNAVLLPCEVPAKDSYVYLLIRDKSYFTGASPLPPVMPVQGGKVLNKLTRLGTGDLKIAAVMRPCEISAAVELAKLKQTDLDNITLISIDCPGAIPTSDYITNTEKGTAAFKTALESWDSDSVREVCKICTRFCSTGSDLHVGLLGAGKNKMFLIPGSKKGEDFLNFLEIKSEADLSEREKKIKEKEKERAGKRKNAHKDLKKQVGGTENFLEAFKDCLNCHNCMRVCPLCYCRQCYFDSEAFHLSAENYLAKAERKGSIRLPSNTLLFHLGRMSHMVSSCVSCGICEEACPVSIPVSQIFSMVADDVQKLFDYVPGNNIDDTIPTVGYEIEELKQFEKKYTETYTSQE